MFRPYNVVRITMTTLLVSCGAETLPGQTIEFQAYRKPRVVIQTDINPKGDPDDWATLVRTLLYANDLEILGIIHTSQSAAGYDMLQSYLKKYGDVAGNLRKHDSRFPDGATMQGKALDAWERRDLQKVVSLLEHEPGPLFVCDWGTSGGAYWDLPGEALDWIKGNRSESHYTAVLNKLYMAYYYDLGNHVNCCGGNRTRYHEHLEGLPLFLDAFSPNRWYHRWKDITQSANP